MAFFFYLFVYFHVRLCGPKKAPRFLLCPEKLLEFESTLAAVCKMVFMGLKVKTSRRKNGNISAITPVKLLQVLWEEKGQRLLSNQVSWVKKHVADVYWALYVFKRLPNSFQMLAHFVL